MPLNQPLSKRISLEQAFGDVVKQRRESLGISQEELAFRAGIHRTYVSQLERGLKSPSLAVIFRIAQAIGLAPDQVVKQVIEAQHKQN